MKNKISIIVTIICSVHIFGLYYNIGEFTYYLLDSIAIFELLRTFIVKRQLSNNSDLHFKYSLTMLFTALFASTISCYLFHDQNIVSTIFAMRYFLYFLVYFQLHRIKLEKEWLHKLIFCGATLYIVIFFLQYYLFPLKIVNYGSIEGFDRGLLRFRIEGAGFLMLAAFLSLNKFILEKKRLQILFYCLSMVCLFMLGFRTLLATAFISSYFLLLRASINKIFILKSSAVLIALLLLALSLPFVQTYISQMEEQTRVQYEFGDDYIRLRTFDFFINKVNVDELSLLFGNGFPQEQSRYGQLVLNQGAKNNGFIFADLGLVGFSIIYGLISAAILIYMVGKAIFSRTKPEDAYLNSYFLYLFLSSFTTVEIYRAGIFGIQALALYLIDYSLKKNESRNFNVSLRK